MRKLLFQFVYRVHEAAAQSSRNLIVRLSIADLDKMAENAENNTCGVEKDDRGSLKRTICDDDFSEEASNKKLKVTEPGEVLLI